MFEPTILGTRPWTFILIPKSYWVNGTDQGIYHQGQVNDVKLNQAQITMAVEISGNLQTSLDAGMVSF
jgi:hypothetical protein